MILVSLTSCLIGIGVYVFDLATDVQFSLDISKFGETHGNNSLDKSDGFNYFLSRNVFRFSSCTSHSQECWDDLTSAFERRLGERLDSSDHEDYTLIGRLAVWHCIQPFLVTFIVFINMNFRKWVSELDCRTLSPRCLHSVFCSLRELTKSVSLLPIPAVTNIRGLFLHVQCHNARSLQDFRRRIVSIEAEITDHETLGKLLFSKRNLIQFDFLFWFEHIIDFCLLKASVPVTLALIIEASSESYFQFWLQSNFSLPDIFSDLDKIDILLTWRTLSIILSFFTIAFSIIKIR